MLMAKRLGNRSRGFTLIELIIALAVVAIIAAIAVPAYQESVRQSRRADAKVALLDLSSRLELYYAENNTYATATIASGNPTDVLDSADSPDGYYTLSFSAQSANAYTIQAAPKPGRSQAGDSRCGTYTLSSSEIKSVSGTGGVDDCW